MKKEHVMDETGLTDNFGFQAWKFILRYITPLLVALVFIGYFFLMIVKLCNHHRNKN
jgi:SNF family Na+-dependent transporter